MKRRKGPAPVTSLPFTPILLRPLPQTVAPFPNETLVSYRRRLAAANQTDFRLMRTPSRWLACPLNELEKLELLSGHSRVTLVWALPELRSYSPRIAPPPENIGRIVRRACTHCGWLSGSNGQPIEVHVWSRHDSVCVKHRRWLNGGLTIRDQVDLTAVPEVVSAQLLLNRLERKYGTEYFSTVYRLCEQFWAKVDGRGLVRKDRDDILDLIAPPHLKTHRRRVDSIKHYRHAANFPNHAKLVRLITSLARKPDLERRVGRITREPQAEFEHIFTWDHRPRRSTLPWFQRTLTELVEQVSSDPELLRLSETSPQDQSHPT